jgi:hypothetical protein
MNSFKIIIAWLLLLNLHLAHAVGVIPGEAMSGPLRADPRNPRYFTDDSGRAIYLTGSHTWGNFQEYHGGANPPPPFDYQKYLDFMARHHHNFMRLWVWESTRADGPKGSIDTHLPIRWLTSAPAPAWRATAGRNSTSINSTGPTSTGCANV